MSDPSRGARHTRPQPPAGGPVPSRMAEAALATFDEAETAGYGRSPITAIVEHRLTTAQGSA